MSSIKIRSKPLEKGHLIRILIDHPMETGRRKDDLTGKIVPAHFITELTLEHAGRPVIEGHLTTAISKNPYFAFELESAQMGDTIVVIWRDNRGLSGRASYKIGSDIVE